MGQCDQDGLYFEAQSSQDGQDYVCPDYSSLGPDVMLPRMPGYLLVYGAQNGLD